MQQQQSVPFCYSNVYDANGSPWMPSDNAKTTQYQNQCWGEQNAFHVGSNYIASQVPGGGTQTRVNVGPQQLQQPSQPTPTSTPPGIHGDMAKQPLPPAATAMGYVQPRSITPITFGRNAVQPPPPQAIRNRPLHNYISMGQVLTQSTQTLVHPVQQPFIMYQQQRQTTPYPNQIFMQPNTAYYNAAGSAQPYYSQVPSIQQYPNLSSGGPSPQATTPQTQMPIVRTPLVPSTPQPPPSKPDKKRSKAIKIIDPDTYEEVIVEDSSSNNNNVTPSRSNDSSARETPQPGAGPNVQSADNTVAAEFAAQVARAMNEETTHSIVSLDSVSDSGDVHHKQPHVVTFSETMSSKLSTACSEFVPRSQTMQSLPPCEIPDEVQQEPVDQLQPPVEQLQLDAEQHQLLAEQQQLLAKQQQLLSEQQQLPLEKSQTSVPTVSAETDSPPVEIQRPPVLTKSPTLPSAPSMQSPLKTTKKQKSNENERQQAAIVPPSASQLQTEVRDIKKGPKSIQREEFAPIPKERKEKSKSTFIEQSSLPTNVIVSEEVPNVPAVVMATTVAKEVKSQAVEDPSENKAQHQNGEILDQEVPPASIPVANAPVPTDSNKTTKRQAGKKSGKMRDLNRRGTEKEGSEMDAFTTEPTILSEEKETSQTAISTPPPTPPPALPEPINDNKIQEDLEEKEDKMVAAKNEENAKVSALIPPEPVVEEKQQPVQLTLRHSYTKDQWSPLNPEGKKKYDRQFLIGLRTDPLCSKKPENLPDAVVGMLRDISNNKNSNYVNPRSDISSMMPQFIRNQSRGGMAPPKGRGSQQGSKKGSRVIQMSLSLNEDVKLKTTENAWKPTRIEGSVGKTEDEKETEELVKNVRGILNKLTPQKFDKLMEKFKVLPINSELRLIEVINLIFEKAVDEPSFSKAYAQMCKMCSKLEVTKMENGKEEKVNFRKLLITRCQTEFEKNKAAELDAEKWHVEINACSDPEKKKETQLAYEEKERAIRMKSVGNIRFIGELFKLGMLTPAIMYRCIEHLLSNPAEESLECLCKLLTTIGKDLELGGNNPPKQQGSTPQAHMPPLNQYFQRMSDLSHKKGNAKVSSRVRFMLQDVIDLRGNKWVPRREDNNPKTIEQINKEAERESMEKAIALSQQPPRMNRLNERPDNRKRGNQNDTEGWNTVNSSRYHNQKYNNAVFESSKINVKPDDLNSLTLGGSSAYRFQTGTKNPDLKTSSTFVSSNVFSALQSKDERKLPQSNMHNRRMTPTPSIEREKERMRMLHGAKENDERSSRENSVQREKESSASIQISLETLRRDEDKPAELTEEELNRLKEKLERQTQTLIEEYLGGLSSEKDVRTEVEQLFTKESCGDFVLKALEMVLERKLARDHRNVGLLITALLDSDICSQKIVTDQFSNIYEMAEDYAIDIPKIWDIQAVIIVPILASQKINFSHFKDACRHVLNSRTASALLCPVLSLLVSEKGEGFVRNLWDSSNVSLSDFLPKEVDVNSFIEEKSLKYLTGEAPKYEVRLPMDQVQQQILRLIQNSQPFETILDFITTNVGDKVEDVSFIRALVAAFCEACITGPDNSGLNLDLFKRYEKLIERFVDHKEDRELACLSSVHMLCSKLQHPKGLILSIFSGFSEDNLICNESFLKWKDDKHVTLENKGVSLYALTSFFATLEEVETDDENS